MKCAGALGLHWNPTATAMLRRRPTGEDVQLHFISSRRVEPKQTRRREAKKGEVKKKKTTTCETKADSRRNASNICRALNSQLGRLGERKSLGCCVALLLHTWIPGRLTSILHKHKTTLCECCLLPGSYRSSSAVEGEVGSTELLKQCLHCVSGELARRDDISVWIVGLRSLSKTESRFAVLRQTNRWLRKPRSCETQPRNTPGDEQKLRLTVHYIMFDVCKKKEFDLRLSLHHRHEKYMAGG